VYVIGQWEMDTQYHGSKKRLCKYKEEEKKV
jgi:hypothetical protein